MHDTGKEGMVGGRKMGLKEINERLGHTQTYFHQGDHEATSFFGERPVEILPKLHHMLEVGHGFHQG